jgi:RNA recognition motif-containing protein
MNIFVGNLAQEVTETDLADLFKPFGQVKSTEVKRDLFSGITKGFGFVEMPGRNHSLAAITALNGRDFKGQPLRVNEAHEFPARGRRR